MISIYSVSYPDSITASILLVCNRLTGTRLVIIMLKQSVFLDIMSLGKHVFLYCVTLTRRLVKTRVDIIHSRRVAAYLSPRHSRRDSRVVVDLKDVVESYNVWMI